MENNNKESPIKTLLNNVGDPKCDNKDKTIIVFPGQGYQYVGMGKDLLKYPKAKDLFELANNILGYDLLKICLEGPQSELNKTIHCQPATVVTSLAALERLKEEQPDAIDNCVATAGYSLGEITALVFAGAMPLEEALRLVKIRAEAMQLASETYPGAMVKVVYGSESELDYACQKAKEWCVEKGVENPVCAIANHIYANCKTVAGNVEAIEYLEKNCEELKLSNLKRPLVIGSFHTDLMLSAVEPFGNAIQKIDMKDPLIPVYSNVDGEPYRDANHIKKQLPIQIIKAVKWEETLRAMYERDLAEHLPRTFECGPGTGLRIILKKFNAKAWESSYSIEA